MLQIRYNFATDLFVSKFSLQIRIFLVVILQMTFPNVLMSTLEVLEFIKATNCYPNASIAYWILLTVSVTGASMERSFSKLKLLKSYLRSSMS